MQVKKGQIVEFDIENLAFGGAGIGRFDGRAVFVKETMPGDKVKASLTKIKKQYMEAKLVEIIEASKERVKPKCKYSSVCGGCQIQFMPYEKQIEHKQQNVIDCFERIGEIKNPPVKNIIPCDNHFYYRNKMEFSFGYDAEMKFTLGMHVPGRRFDILDLDECHLESELSYEIVNIVRKFMHVKKWQPFKYSNGKGFLKHLSIREGKRTDKMLINLITSNALPKDIEEGLNEFVELIKDKVTSIYWTQVISKRGTPRRHEEKLLFGEKYLTEEMHLENGDQLSFDILPQAFFQVNTFQAEKLYQEVINLATEKDHKIIFDLFCGTGTIGLFLAKHAEKVLGIEINESAVKAAKANAEKNNIFNIDFFNGDVAKVLKEIKELPSLVVVDPPRVGLTAKAIEQINDFNPKEIIYVSCNPSTLARDVKIFKEYGFKLKTVQPVDMFPHTFHIENVCLLVR